MNMATIIAVIALVLIVFFAVRYLVKAKKRGEKCVGCPYCDSCGDPGAHRESKGSCCH